MTDDQKRRSALIVIAALEGVADFPWEAMLVRVEDDRGREHEVRLNARTVEAVWRKMCDEVVAYVRAQGGVQ